MKIELEGRWVWITGASSGIGAETAKEAARRGAAVILSGRNTAALEEVRAACAALSGARGTGTRHEVLAFDLLDRGARAAAVQKALAVSGGLALAVLNAGVSQRARFEDLPPEAFDRIMELDFNAPVDLVRRLLPSFGKGRPVGIVLVSSIAGLVGAPQRSAYAAAKHALSGFGAVLRCEVADRNIAITTIYPGYVRTALAHAAVGPGGRPSGRPDPDIEGGADPARVAARIMAAAVAGRPQLIVAPSLEARAGLFLTRHWPAMYLRLAASKGRRMARDGAGS
jgi:NAD(P)-dependent dehydrogenase (short-subunit alcohol dehydrogenase family)